MSYGAAMSDLTQLQRCGELSGRFTQLEARNVTIITSFFG
jgi:hypothetical protein